MLAARGVERLYGRRVALAATDLELAGGEVVALVGPNGAGKSTLLAILAGALPPSAGVVSTAEPAPAIGWAPQRPAQYGHLSARENLLLFARLAGLREPAAAAASELEAMGLPPEQPASELSVGNQQRLNLAIAQLGDPDVLLLDEPTASLDPEHRRGLWERVRRLSARGGAVVLATHVLEEVDRLAGRVVALHDGRAVYSGPPGGLRAALPGLATP